MITNVSVDDIIVIGGVEMSISDNIKKRRVNLEMTQKQLAEICSLSESSIKYYETGSRNPKKETLDKIAEALNCSYWDLVYPEEERKKFSNYTKKINILDSIKQIAKLSDIDVKEIMITEEPEYDIIQGEKVCINSGEFFGGIEIKYKDKVYSITEENYYKLADKIIKDVAINLIAAKDFII